MALRSCLLALYAFAVWMGEACASETDQYLVWGVELEDSSQAINRYLNTEIDRFLEERNRADQEPCSGPKLTRRIYLHFFQGLHSSRLRHWLGHSSEVDRYPEDSVTSFQHQKMTIYRGRSFPYFLPLARTIRVGDVYCGKDKLAHFFGFGRRYYNRYLRLRAQGKTEQEALEKVVLAGIAMEGTLVGKLVDGIFSHGDLEADFQGLLMARDLCDGPEPHLVLEGGRWKRVRPIDIRAYVTPDFDESYNPCHYWALRKRFVLPILAAEYRSKAASPAVQERFDRYRLREPSLAKRVIRAHFEKNGTNPQEAQFIEAFGLRPGCLPVGSGSATTVARFHNP